MKMQEHKQGKLVLASQTLLQKILIVSIAGMCHVRVELKATKSNQKKKKKIEEKKGN